MTARSMSITWRFGVLLAAWVTLTGILIAAGTIVVHSSTIASFDRHVTSLVVAHRTPALNAAMKAMSWLGSWIALVTAAILVVISALRGRLAWLAVLFAIAAWAGEAGAVSLAKHVVQRNRPPMDIWLKTAHGWSWPSGHTATAVLAFAILAILITQIFSSQKATLASWLVAITAMVAVGFSRIELGLHWATDVVASFVFVSIWLLIIVTLFAAELQEASVSEDRGLD